MEILKIFLSWLIPFAAGSLISLLGSLLSEKKKREKRYRLMEKGIQCLLRENIITQCDKWIDREYCPYHEKYSLKKEYEAYSGLDGNDVAETQMNLLMELPDHKREEN